MLVILAEKHSQERAYVKALQGDNPIKQLNKYVVQIKDSPVLPDYPDIRIAYLQGHLYELYEPAEYDKKWEKWDLNTLPIFPEEMKMHLKRGFGGRRKCIADQIHACDDLWLASDSDVEGENLGYIFLAHNQGLPKLNGRVWQNSQTKPSLIKAFHHIRNPKDTIGNAHSGYSRMLADWYIGMNYSRLMSILLHQKGYQGVYSVGRVQTPTLHLINERRNERARFHDSSVFAISAIDSQGLKFNSPKEQAFKTKKEAQRKIQVIQSHPLVIQDVQERSRDQSAPKLYKTGKVQGYLISHRHISAKFALDNVLENMYNRTIISYPRTDCDLLTLDDYNELKKKLSQYAKCYEDVTQENISPYLINLEPNRKHVDFDGKKVQKIGHHALTTDRPISAAEYHRLNPNEKSAYLYILKSVLAMFMPDHQYKSYEIQAQNHFPFVAHYDKDMSHKDWKLLYPNNDEEEPSHSFDISQYQSGKNVAVDHYEPREIKAKPPKAITESNLLKDVMPRYHLGTQATRGDIIANLTSRKIVAVAKEADKEQHRVKGEFIPTDKGVTLLEAMRDTNLLDLAKVQSWEDRMTAIAQGDEKVTGFLKEIKEAIYQDIQKLPQEELRLSTKPDRHPTNIQDKHVTKSGLRCPKCGQGDLEHLTMVKDHKHLDFYSCTNSKCKFMAPGNFAGMQITPQDLRDILTGNTTDHRFKSKKGNHFTGRLVYAKGKIRLKFADDGHPTSQDIGISCPKCRMGELRAITYQKQGRTHHLYVCSNDSCRFIAPTQIAGMNVTPAVLKTILTGDFPVSDFQSKRGKSFRAKLIYRQGDIKFQFDDSQRRSNGTDTRIRCPQCKRGRIQIITYRKSGQKKNLYVCSNENCEFMAPTHFAGIQLTPDVLESILTGSFTKQTFISKKKHSKYEARLVYQGGKIQMSFD